MKNKHRKNIWFIIFAFVFIFTTGQICTGWGGNGDGEDNGSEDVQEAGEEEMDDEEAEGEEDD
jgi:hypothetical protein